MPMNKELFQHHLWETLSFFHLNALHHSRNQSAINCMGYCCFDWFLILFQLYRCLTISKYHKVMITEATNCLETIWNDSSHFIFQNCLSILVSFPFKFWNNVIYICKKMSCWDSDRNSFKTVSQFEENQHC